MKNEQLLQVGTVHTVHTISDFLTKPAERPVVTLEHLVSRKHTAKRKVFTRLKM